MNRPHFTIFCPIHTELSAPTKWVLQNLEYSGEYSFVIHQSGKRFQGRTETETKYLNCSNARNEAKAKALDRGQEWFVSLDSDVVPPVDFLERFAVSIETFGPGGKKMEIIGGWYPQKAIFKALFWNEKTQQREMMDFRRYVAGRWTAPDTFSNYISVRKNEWAPSSQVPLGCCLMHRSILELTEFRSGFDRSAIDGHTGQKIALGECLEFGLQAEKLGSDIFMNSNVVCRHV